MTARTNVVNLPIIWWPLYNSVYSKFGQFSIAFFMASIIKLNSDFKNWVSLAAKPRRSALPLQVSGNISNHKTDPLLERTHRHIVGLINSGMGVKENQSVFPEWNACTSILICDIRYSKLTSTTNAHLHRVNPLRKVKSFPFKRFTNTKPKPKTSS